MAVDVERRRAELRVEKSQQLLRLQQDLAEQEATLERVARSFEHASGFLYEEPGSLEISVDASGLQLRPAIQGDRSSGVRRMEIFSFDMALYAAAASVLELPQASSFTTAISSTAWTFVRWAPRSNMLAARPNELVSSTS